VTAHIRALIDRLAALPGSDRLFNPYTLDHPGGAIRRANLTRYLADMHARQPHSLLLFEAPGYRGCALSGIPVTSERIMLRGIARWGLFGQGYLATSGQPGGVAEMTATILWGALAEIAPEPPLIWNTVPLHPHRPGQRASNRTPSAAEQEMGLALIRIMIDLFGCQTILAVGRTAQRALTRLAIESIPVRHPSQGGKPEFVAGLSRFYTQNR
jgi:hypothetical protein